MSDGVASAEEREDFKRVLHEHWKSVYNFAFRMCLDGQRARDVVEESFLRAYVGQEKLPDGADAQAWLLRIANHVAEKLLPRKPELSFEMLDDTLRSEATRTDVVRSLTEPRRDFLLWELKQGCMTAVVNCLPPGERSAFVVSNILKLDDEVAAKTLGVSKSAYKVRLSRAKKKVADYLAPRCEHVDPGNPCRCPARVGVALKKGFIRPMGEVDLRKPVEPFGRYGAGPGNEDAPQRDVVTIYGNLPEPEPPEELLAHMVRQVDEGQWDRVREQKLSSREDDEA